LLRHVLVTEAKSPGVAVDDIGDHQSSFLVVEAALDLEVEIRPAGSGPRLLDYLEGAEGELAELFQKFGGDHRIAAVGEGLLADEVSGVDSELNGRLRVGHQ